MGSVRVAALISGGKDSCFSMMQCIAEGFELVALANLYPVEKDELDSYMFQTVGHQGVEYIAKAIGLPLYREPTFGRSKVQGKEYCSTEDDEVEDLYRLLRKVKCECDILGVVSGPILSDYQRVRVENVCTRLDLTSLAFLWRRKQDELLKEMIECSVNAVLIKVAALGLEPSHLGKSLSEMQTHLAKTNEKYGINICGEGGEYETFTLDCPLFTKSIVIDEYESIVQSNDNIAPVGYLNFKKIHLQEKDQRLEGLSLRERLRNVPIKTAYDYIAEITHPVVRDDINLSDDEIDEDYSTSYLVERAKSDKLPPSNTLYEEKILYEKEDYIDMPIVNKNQNGWFWFSGIVVKQRNFAVGKAMEKLSSLVKEQNLQMSDIVAITFYVREMIHCHSIRAAYKQHFGEKSPPVILFVESPIKEQILLDAVAYKEVQDCGDKEVPKRHTMCVLSLSFWAPAPIPYSSQAIRVGDIIFVSGQRTLVPCRHDLVGIEAKKLCRLSLRHIHRIIKAMDSNMELRNIVQGICFVTHSSYIPDARKEWEKRTNNAIMDYIVVPYILGSCPIEWYVWAHRDNNSFEYEETSKYVGNFKVAIRRRWNYENNVSAIVCNMSTGSSNSTGNLATETSLPSINLTESELTEALEYALHKLTEGTQTVNPTCQIRIFYKVRSSPGLQFIQDVLLSFSRRNLVTTIVPATCLNNFSTILSIFGIRYE